ncbi:histamine N-methyltransferase-like [Saccoglossus kowalevskii]
MEEIKSLGQYPVEFHHRYDVTKKHGKNVEGDSWIKDAKETFAKLDLDPTHELRVLSIGCGNGKVDEPIIDVLLKKYSKIHYIALDPMPDELRKFRELVKARGDEWKNVTFDFQEYTIKEHLRTNNQPYGLVVASHSAYYFDDIEQIVMQLYDSLLKNGMLFIRMESDTVSYHFQMVMKCWSSKWESSTGIRNFISLDHLRSKKY